MDIQTVAETGFLGCQSQEIIFEYYLRPSIIDDTFDRNGYGVSNLTKHFQPDAQLT